MIEPEEERVSNITGYTDYNPWQAVLMSIIKGIIHDQSNQVSSLQEYGRRAIEIELKYCLFVPRLYEEKNYNITKYLSKKSGIHYHKEISNFTAGFPDQKRFYAMREFLFNICKANQEIIPEKSFYRGIRQFYSNKKYRFGEKELRVDVNCDGLRHTFVVGGDWSAMRKTRINDHLDMIFCQENFRFSFNQEEKVEFNKNQLMKALKNPKVSIRIKNIFKFEKNEEIEISMSEVLKHNEKKENFLECFVSLIDKPVQELSEFVISYFANFYNEIRSPYASIDSSAQLEIESEVLQEKYQSLVRQLQMKQELVAENFFERMVQDLQSLVWADYALRKHQTDEIKKLYREKQGREPKEIPNFRFEALRGDYMRNQIRESIGASRC